MGWKSMVILPVAKFTARRLHDDDVRAADLQAKTLRTLLQRASATQIGQELGFSAIQNSTEFSARVPIRTYEEMRPFIDRIIAGQRDVLWPGIPRYFAKSSGTTSGIKYIPITSDSIPNHIGSARNALFNYVAKINSAAIFDGRMIFLSGSPVLESKGNIPTGRLSGIVNHLLPQWIRRNQLPSYGTNCIEDWEQKVDAIVHECLQYGKRTPVQDMRVISGIPPWVQMFYERLLEQSGKRTIKELFPNYGLFVYGGVNYAPYAAKLSTLAGNGVDTLETYPASEGFIAFQDRWPSEGLRLNINSGIFFEFVPTDQLHQTQPDRLTLADVETGKDYAILITSNAGLWAYNIGDTVRFVSKEPYRIVVSGRTEHFISAFGEHVIAKEVDQAISEASTATGIHVTEFTVAPQVNPADGKEAYHEWFIEFDVVPGDLTEFRNVLEQSMIKQNIYYKDLIDGNILRPLVITIVPKDGFRRYMEREGKLGGQNKVPRLKNDRRLVEALWESL